MTPNDDLPNPVDQITERFLSEYRQGLHPDVNAYCQQHPELLELQAVLSAALMLENARPNLLDWHQPLPLSPRPLIRERLGDYRLIREAGSGGMGIVYEAIQESLGRRVAVKTLPSSVMGSSSQLQRFLREAKAVASLHHTNIVPVFAVGEDAGVHYYVMPFIDGIGLEKILRDLKRQAFGSSSLVNPSGLPNGLPDIPPGERETEPLFESDQAMLSPTADQAADSQIHPLTHQLYQHWQASHRTDNPLPDYWHRVASIGLQACNAIHYANVNGVLHRDVKPSNLLLDDNGVVWLTDFGLAKVAQNAELTMKGELLGTLRYLAPERLQGSYDVRGDIYSLGLTLYELLTLEAAFDGVTKPKLVQQIERFTPPRPRHVDRRIPLDLETIVQKASAKDPGHRYQSADQMAEDLRLFLANRPIQSRRASALELSYRWCRRNPTVTLLSACIAGLILASFVFLSAANARLARETKEKSAALTAKDRANHDREEALQQSRENELLAKRRFYAAQVNLAGQAFVNREVTRAEDLLSTVVPRKGAPDFRGYEWYYLLSALQAGLQQTLSYEQEITSLAFAPDERRLLVAGGNLQSGFACVSEIDSGKRLFDCPDVPSNVNGTAYSPDGKMFALALGNGHLQVYDADSFKLIQAIETGVLLKSLAWSPDGKLLAAGSEAGELLFWQTPEFKLERISAAHQGPIVRVFFSGDSLRFFSSTDWGTEARMSRRWDTKTWPPEFSQSYPGQSLCDESSDGNLIGVDWGALVLSDRDGELIKTQTVSTGPLAAAQFVADGKSLLVAARTDRAVRSFDSADLSINHAVSQDNSIAALAIGPANRFWAAGDSKGNVRVWQIKPPEFQTSHVDPDVLNAFLVPGQDNVVLSGEMAAATWSLKDRSLQPFHHAHGLRAISTDQQTMVGIVRDPEDPSVDIVQIWRAGESTAEQIKLADHLYQQCLALSDSGKWLATRTDGKPISLYDLSKSPAVLVHSLEAPSYQFAFSHDDKWLITGQQYGFVGCFDVATGVKQTNYAEFDNFWAWGMSVAVSDDNRYVAAGNESGTIRVWELESRKLVASLSAQPGEIRSIVFFPDHQRLAAGGTGDVRIWDFQSGQELLGLPVAGGLVTHLELNPAGDTLVAVTPTGLIQAWIAKHANPSTTSSDQ